MKMKYIAGAIVFLALVAVAWAMVPPPPANQLLGIYDTTVGNFNETLCRGCHTSGLPDRHHILTGPPTNEYGCPDCHPPITGGGIIVDRNCIVCHNGSGFYGDPATIAGKPHHNTTQAQNLSCEFCHGSVIDNTNDGHYIPTYPQSLVTPDTSFKAVNQSTGKKWGGCEACHEPSPIGPGVPLTISANVDTHHSEVVGVTQGISCLACHNTSAGSVNIRSCEQCHGVRSLHNIQYNFTGTQGVPGYGHLGANWDCNGCHAWYVAGAAPLEAEKVPVLDSITPSRIEAGKAAVLTIKGSNFLQSGYPTVVDIEGTSYTPATLTDTSLTVNIPALAAGVYETKVKVGTASSKLASLTVYTKVTISRATLSSGTITITGAGFGTIPQVNPKYYVTIKKQDGKTYYSDSITSWSGSQIKAKSTSAVGDTVTVTRADGTGSASKAITRR